MAKQPKDSGGVAIPLLSFKPASGQKISTSGTPTRSGVITSMIVTLYSDTDCYIELGDVSVEANTSSSMFVPASIPFDLSMIVSDSRQAYISVISTGTGTLYISERV